MHKLLIANRGEIAIRILRAASELGLRSVAVYSEDDAAALHVRRADEAEALQGKGAAAYLDIAQLIAAAVRRGCGAVHPGYGFLSENAAFAHRAAAAGITFVGPRPETLELLGDKTKALAVARRCGVPVLEGSHGAVSAAAARDFLGSLAAGGAMIIKAVAGGGGRGLCVVRRAGDVDEEFARCSSEALRAFGSGELYVERFLPGARHVEVQIVGDRFGAVVALGERECSIQRRHQKLIEIAPCPSLTAGLRARLVADAVRIAESVGYENAGTFEFLVDATAGGRDASYAFIEANPRLQVEHTVTEEVMGVDLVKMQLELAAGRSLADLGLTHDVPPAPRGFAIEVRVNAETMDADGTTRPASGAVTHLDLPSGPGVRVDTAAHGGYRTNPNFDSLLAKVVCRSRSSSFADAAARAQRALSELEIEGVRTNVPFLRRLLAHPDFVANRIDTGFVDDHLGELIDPADFPLLSKEGARGRSAAQPTRLDPTDPLAVLSYGKGEGSSLAPTDTVEPVLSSSYDSMGLEETVAMHAPMQGTIVGIAVCEGEAVRQGQAVLVMNAMKMEHVIHAAVSGVVRRVAVAEGDTVAEGRPLLFIEVRDVEAADLDAPVETDLGHVRADLGEAARRHRVTLDESRPDAVERRRKTGQRTARENVADLCDDATFVEYGALAIAAQRQRRTMEDLIERTPADGLVAGVGRVNGHLFDAEKARCAVLSYDYTVLAGTQGFQNHRKKDRLFEIAERLRLPVVFFTEGGGGRPGDTDAPGVAGLDCMAFHLFGRLSGLVPLVGINSGRCFAGNAALLGCCDVVIATENSSIGMGGPAMIEGGGLGVFRPEEVGPMRVQVPNGVVDIAVADEAEAVRAAKKYLSYFQGTIADWDCADQRLLRAVVPENRLRVYEVRSVIETLADAGSVLELRRDFGLGMVTALIRVEGRPLGVVANNPKHLAGAIDSPGADKAARFLQLCDAFDIPILFLCDTPGIMVGPEVEKTALVRHCCRLFVVGGSLTVPFFTIVLRKSYGLGAQAMAGGSHKAPIFTVSWPTGEFGGMGLEGAVKLGFRKELAAIEDPAERKKAFDHMVARAYQHGEALNTATHFEIDDVIDPAESRRWIASALRAAPPAAPRRGKKRPCVDTW
jgi:acetyl/propionyl-CoA carboxylase alpha subunit/acetyl-CoA carboxylase carboxyltransferase component